MTNVEVSAVAVGRRRVLSAVEGLWNVLQAEHADVPDVLVSWATDPKRSNAGGPQHLRPGQWAGELVMTDARAAWTPEQLVDGLCHEAAHAVAAARQLEDTSRNGRYHNAVYRGVAEELGMDVTVGGRAASGETTVPEGTLARLLGSAAGRELADALAAYDAPEPPAPVSALKVTVACACTGAAARSFLITVNKLALGGIRCEVCGQPFKARQRGRRRPASGPGRRP